MLRDKEYYDSYVAGSKVPQKFQQLRDKPNASDIVGIIENTHFTSKEKIEDQCSKIASITIPCFSVVRHYLSVRNELAHRNGHMSYKGESAPEIVSKGDVLEVIKDIESFVDQLVKNVQDAGVRI